MTRSPIDDCSPMVIVLTSARRIAPYQIDERAPTVTLPITEASEATNDPAMFGWTLPNFTLRRLGTTAQQQKR
jgi:hypothetical protein